MGFTTPIVRAAVTAASTALPPAERVASAASVAAALSVVTAHFHALGARREHRAGGHREPEGREDRSNQEAR